MTIPVLRTRRLVLRGWNDDDREPFARMNADPRVMEHFAGPLTREDSDGFLDRIVAHWRADGFAPWAVERIDDGRFLGFAGLAAPGFVAPFTPAVEVGWRFEVAAWGHGYATEAAQAALRFGFEDLGLAEIVSFTIPLNVRSRAVMERLGMTHDPADDFDHPRFPPGHRIRHHVLYRLSRDRWADRADG
jgi:RimJ/RimL family protein N-acetyltransferase